MPGVYLAPASRIDFLHAHLRSSSFSGASYTFGRSQIVGESGQTTALRTIGDPSLRDARFQIHNEIE